MTQSNIDVVKKSWEYYQTGDLAGSRSLFADSFVAHVAGYPRNIGIDEYAAQGKDWLKAFPDFHLEIEDYIVEGDRVVTRAVINGTHQGDLMGIPATGKRVRLPGILIDRVNDGKIIERWASWDLIGLMNQVGLMPTLDVVQSPPGRLLLWIAVKGRAIIGLLLSALILRMLCRKLRGSGTD
jgi:steroid delta-isomerase-like uncharacterized protein